MVKRIYVVLAAIFILAPGVRAQEAPRSGTHYEKGYELYRAGQYLAAQTELRKALETSDPQDAGEREMTAYLLADCASRLGEDNAASLSSAFLAGYPGSIHTNDIRFSAANHLFSKGDYSGALKGYLSIGRSELPSSSRNEYIFKTAYSYFMLNDQENAEALFRQVGEGDYKPHAQYYIAYIDYTNGRYAVAKRGFQELASNASYERIIPFYLLQIEFLEGNYAYVLRHGDELMRSAQGDHAMEIARIMGESYFHSGDFRRTLEYMSIYRRAGGKMGRAENYLIGYSQYMQNDITDAIESLSRAAGPDDKLTQNASYHLGGAYLRAGDKRGALRSFSMAAAADYDPAIREDAMFNYGKLQFELGTGVFNEAINILSKYIAEYPDSPRVNEAREYLTAAYYNSKNYEAAYDAIKLIRDPDNNIRTALQKISYFRALEYYNAGDRDTARQLLEESLRNKFNPKYTALTQFWLGEIEYNAGNYKKAIPLYRDYVSLSPASENEHRMALYNLGYCYFNGKQWDEARRWFDRFIAAYNAKDSYRADAYNRIGDIQFARREFSKATESYDAAARLGTPERYYSQFQRAVVMGFANKREAKIEALTGIINAKQGGYVDEAMYELGRTYIGMDRFHDAAATMRRFIEAYPESNKYTAALSDLGLICQNMGDNTNAIRYYKTVVEQAPSSPEAKDAMLALKSIYVSTNDVDSYFSFAAASGVETDTGAMTRDSLAYAAAMNVYMQSRNNTEQTAALQGYLNKYPNGVYRGGVLYEIAGLHDRGGRKEQAITSLKELSAMHYNDYTVRGLEKLGALLTQQKRSAEAVATYKQMSAVAVNPQTISLALEGYLKNTVTEGNDARIESAADEILSSAAATTPVRREASFAKAEVLTRRGDTGRAEAIYRELANEVNTLIGAKSTLKVIEAEFAGGNLDKTEKMVLDFAAKNTPHTYELGRAFLVLGDVYARKGDTFQARATLQSIIDGYSPRDDGTIEAARQRIEKLK